MSAPRLVRALLFTAVLLATASGLLAQERLQTVEFDSPAVERTMKYNIVLPQDYDASDERYPVVYLLHGLTSNYTAWGRQGSAFYADVFGDVIVVMPDGGNSWYVNYAESSGGQKNDWEDHIVQDVVDHVDGHFRSIARREGRAIAGLSMGGYGALAMGLRNPDLFVSIGSTSGALAYARTIARRMRGEPAPGQGGEPLTAEEEAERERRRRMPNPAIGIEGFNSQTERTPQGKAFATADEADAYDPFQLIHKVPRNRLPHIYLDSGTDDRLIGSAREFAQILFANDIPFDFMQMPGGHNGVYWTRSLGHIMSIQVEVMRRALGQRPER